MALDLGELYTTIDVRDKGLNKIDRAGHIIADFDKTTTEKIANVVKTLEEGGEQAGEGLAKGIDKGLTDAELRMKGFQRDAQGRLRTLSGRFASEAEKAGLGLGDGIDKSSRPGLSRFGDGIDESHRRLSHLGKGLNALGGVFGSLKGLIAIGVAAAPALAPLLGLMLALPVAAAGAIIAMGTLKLALKGVGEAMGASLSGDAAAFDAALQKLTPTARGVVKDIGGAFFGLQKTAQSAFFAPMKRSAELFGQNLKGPLKTGISQVASSLGGVGSQILALASGPTSVGVLKDLFAGVASAVDGIKPGLLTLLTGIRDLIGVFVPGLGEAGSAIGSAMTRWGEWMSSIASSGQALSWFETAKQVLSQLWDIGGNVASMIKGIFNAGGDGGGLLGTIEKITAAMSEWANSAQGQEQLAAVFSLLSQVGSNLATILPVVATILGGIATVMTSLPAPVQGVVTGLLALAAAWKILGITSLINGAKMAAAWVLGLGPVGWIIMAVIALVALIIMYWDEIVAFLEEAWQGIKDFAVEIWNGILDFFREWGPLLLAIVTGGVSLLVEWIVTHWDEIKAWTVSTWNSIVDFFVGIWQGIGRIVMGGVAKVLAFIDFLKQIPTRARVWFQQMKDAAVSKLRDLIAWAKGLPGRIITALGNLRAKLLKSGRDMIQGMLNGLRDTAHKVWDWLKGLLSGFKDRVKKFFGISSPSRLMAYFGRMIGTGLADGVKGTTGIVQNASDELNKAIALPEADVALNASASTLSTRTMRLSEDDRNLLRSVEASATIPDTQLDRLASTLAARPARAEVSFVEVARAVDTGQRQLARRG